MADSVAKVEARGEVSILLVGDPTQRLLSYGALLGDLGLDLVCARSGREALATLMNKEFAVVLLDVGMPDIDSLETAKRIHEHPRLEMTPIIFVTDVPLEHLDRLEGDSLGAVDYLSIPIVPQILRRKVCVLVELFLKRRQLQTLTETLACREAQLADANVALQQAKTRELEGVNASLQRANADLEAVNRTLQSEVAERLRVEQVLKEADRHKDEFLAMLAHELRNPLAPIHNAVQLMRQKPLADPQLEWARDLIARQLIDLTRLVDGFLDVSRITRGKINLNKEIVELGNLISRAIETVHPLLDERRHSLILELPDPRVTIHGDPTRLTQAIADVLGNAAKYTDAGGKIILSVSEGADEVEIRIRDNGVGIDPKALPLVFELFNQGDQIGDGTRGGLGIGLALVKRVVELHGGGVSAWSAGPGTGAEIRMRLPRHRDSAGKTAPAAAAANAASTAAEDLVVTPAATATSARLGRRILIADDNNDALESLATLLQIGGHEVFTATNGRTALQCAEHDRPEVALLDIGMPILDGYEVARRIRAQPWGERMTLVALTGWGQDSDRRRSREAGFDSHMVKPLDLDVLAELLAQLPADAASVRERAVGEKDAPSAAKSASAKSSTR